MGFVETIGIAILLPFLDYLLNNDNSEYLNISNYFSKYNLQLPNFLSKVHIITFSNSFQNSSFNDEKNFNNTQKSENIDNKIKSEFNNISYEGKK